jgi:hypothetical protein
MSLVSPAATKSPDPTGRRGMIWLHEKKRPG